MKSSYLCHNYIMFDFILNILYPDSCLGCHKANVPLCTKCVDAIPDAPYTRDNHRARFAYADPIMRKAIRALKYRHASRIAGILGPYLADIILEDFGDVIDYKSERTIIVPAPLSRERLAERGVNQDELLAESVSNITGLYSELAVEKIRHTESQVALGNRKARLHNLEGAFNVPNPTSVARKDVLIIDDVYTTGATIRELSRTLRAAGARSTRAYTLAH